MDIISKFVNEPKTAYLTLEKNCFSVWIFIWVFIFIVWFLPYSVIFLLISFIPLIAINLTLVASVTSILIACLIGLVSYYFNIPEVYLGPQDTRDFCLVAFLFIHYSTCGLFLVLKPSVRIIFLGYLYLFCFILLFAVYHYLMLMDNQLQFKIRKIVMIICYFSVCLYLLTHYLYLFKTLKTVKIGYLSLICSLALLAYCIRIVYPRDIIMFFIPLSIFSPILLGLISILATYCSKVPVKDKQYNFVWIYFVASFGGFLAFIGVLSRNLG